MNHQYTQLDVVQKFYDTLVAKDWKAMRAILTDDAHWKLPGDNTVSGTAEGADNVVERAQKISGYGLNFELLHILVSKDNAALSLRNTAQQGERILDEYLCTVCYIKDSKIVAIETFLSDVKGMNAFFIDTDE